MIITGAICFSGVDNAYSGVAPIEINGVEPKYHKYYQVKNERKIHDIETTTFIFSIAVGSAASGASGMLLLCSPLALEILRREENVHACRGNIIDFLV
jgi:hypothetical protein